MGLYSGNGLNRRCCKVESVKSFQKIESLFWVVILFLDNTTFDFFSLVLRLRYLTLIKAQMAKLLHSGQFSAPPVSGFDCESVPDVENFYSVLGNVVHPKYCFFRQ